MNEQNNEKNTDTYVDLNFFNIVVSLSQAAMVGMGKISNPQSNQVEKNMDMAKINVDILQMLKEKTKGNLTKKEDEIMSDTLANLQLTYADEMKLNAEEKKEEIIEEDTKTESDETAEGQLEEEKPEEQPEEENKEASEEK